MRFSNLFCPTLKEVPNDAVLASHQLMLRAGLIQKSGSGLYNYLPLGLRVLKKIEAIICQELDAVCAQEIAMSVVTPAELWNESGRLEGMKDVMIQFQDKAKRSLCLSPTNEEVVVDLFRKFVKTYKQLPLTFYQINTKFRDEIRPRFGLMRAREFVMKDAYSFHMTKACLDHGYAQLQSAYQKIFDRLGLSYLIVEADAGDMADAGAQTHEFQAIADSGEDELVVSSQTKTGSNIEKAITYREPLEFDYTTPQRCVHTPEKESIGAVATFLNVPEHQCLKSLVYGYKVDGEQKWVMVIVLGDDSVNDCKLRSHLRVDTLFPARDRDFEELGLVKGYVGPEKATISIVLDAAIDEAARYVVGANKKGYHYSGFSISSCQYTVCDIRKAKKGDCDEAGEPIIVKRGIEVGHIFQLGNKYTQSLKASVLTKEGVPFFPLMGCYGIGVGRSMAAVIEQSHDDLGIIWPWTIAPFQISVILTSPKDAVLSDAADKLYNQLKVAGYDVLLDDRDVSPGFKFKDADLIGFPIRMVIGKTWLKEKKIEVKSRKKRDVVLVEEGRVMSVIREFANEF